MQEEETDLIREILSLDEKQKQTLYDSLHSSVINNQTRDTVLHLIFTKAVRLLRETGKIRAEETNDTEFAKRIGNLSSRDRQVLFDSVCSSVTNQNDKETVLHILFWKASKLLKDKGEKN